MAIPNPFQKLRHGALLCKKNFGTFVETFNFLIDFVRNIKGDGDAGGSGKIILDRSAPDMPVIRFIGKESSGGSSYVPNAAPFDIQDVGGTKTVVNCSFYFNNTIKQIATYTIPDGTLQSGSIYLNGYCYIGNDLWVFNVWNSPQEQSESMYSISLKLYDFTDGVVTMDYRTSFLTAVYGVTSVRGQTAESPELSKDIMILGSSHSGIEVRSDTDYGIIIDIDGREDNEYFSIRNVTKEDDQGGQEVIAKVLGTNDIDIPKAHPVESEEDTLSFLTDIDYDTATGYIRVKTKEATLTTEQGKHYLTKIGAESEWTYKIATTPHDTSN